MDAKPAMNLHRPPKHELPKSVYLTAPIVFVASAYFLQWLELDRNYLFSEYGVYELLTFVFLLLAIIACMRLLFCSIAYGLFRLWIALLLMGAVYFAGEEISWGQHFFAWQTPPGWQAVNDQGETNLHNTHALLDQLPRNLLTLAAILGGIAMPLWRGAAGHHPSPLTPSGWLWPTYACLPSCALAVAVSLFDDWAETRADLPFWLDTSGGELKEGLLAMFILFYAASLLSRLSSFQKL